MIKDKPTYIIRVKKDTPQEIKDALVEKASEIGIQIVFMTSEEELEFVIQYRSAPDIIIPVSYADTKKQPVKHNTDTINYKTHMNFRDNRFRIRMQTLHNQRIK